MVFRVICKSLITKDYAERKDAEYDKLILQTNLARINLPASMQHEYTIEIEEVNK